jgi:replicative DNA helicase
VTTTLKPTTLTVQVKAPDPGIIAVERALIGGCLTDTRGVRLWPTLQASEFYLERHRTIWQAMQDLTEVTDHPTLLDLTEELRRRGELDEVGGPAAIATMVEEGMLVFDIPRYGHLVRRAATERAKTQFAATLISNPEMPAEEIEQVLQALYAVAAAPQTTAIEALEFMQERARTEQPISTGIRALDEHLGGGLLRGQVIVIGGRTSRGKTAFAAQMARKMALDGVAVDYLALEDSGEVIQARWLAQVTGIPANKFRQSVLDAAELREAQEAATEIDAAPLRVMSFRATPEARVLAEVAASRATVVILDYLQVVSTEGEARHYELERVMSRLAHIAAADRKLIIVTAQLSRAAAMRNDRPTLADLKDSGSTEQIARQVWLLYWIGKEQPDKAASGDFEVIIAKNSEGSCGTLTMFYEPALGRFSGNVVRLGARS